MRCATTPLTLDPFSPIADISSTTDPLALEPAGPLALEPLAPLSPRSGGLGMRLGTHPDEMRRALRQRSPS
jgi:hypothetical protein